MKVVALFFALFAGNVSASVFQFLYIEASEGSSSGGHVAVQLGDEVYHYQYDDGLIRLFKNNGDAFRNNYRFKQNRTIHVADIEVPELAYSQLKNHFKLKYFEQKQTVRQLTSTQEDLTLLQALLHGKHDEGGGLQASGMSLTLPGAGLFYPAAYGEAANPMATCQSKSASVSVLAEVSRQLESHHGKALLPQKIKSLRKAIGTLLPLDTETLTKNQYAFSERYSDLLNGLLVLGVIEKRKQLAKNACFQVDLPELKLSAQAIAQTKAYREVLLGSAQNLLVSDRPDWAYALFVTLARLIAVEQAIQTGVWTFVDDVDDSAKPIAMQRLSLYVQHSHQERSGNLQRLQKRVSAFIASSAYERNYANLEMAANRYRQWLIGAKTGYLRYHAEQALPTKAISATGYLITDLPKEKLEEALQIKEREVARLVDNDEGHNAYHLLANNCVTALFALINAGVNGQSEALLGGFIEPKNTIIPFRAFAAVQDNYNVVSTKELPAYRQQELAKLYQNEMAGWVYARESNVFSSSLYAPNPDDAWFVFFTDDAFLLRPVFGAVNTVAAASQSLWGLFSWPFESENKTIKIGARGLLASLPELAFFNIRKGSYPYAMQH